MTPPFDLWVALNAVKRSGFVVGPFGVGGGNGLQEWRAAQPAFAHRVAQVAKVPHADARSPCALHVASLVRRDAEHGRTFHGALAPCVAQPSSRRYSIASRSVSKSWCVTLTVPSSTTARRVR